MPRVDPVLSFVILGLRSSLLRLAKTGLVTASAVVITACGKSDDSQIVVYRIPKEPPPAQPVENTSAQADRALSVHWKAPSDWEEQPASGFRKGSYRLRGADGKTADISVISFPESAGGLLANVNRWRNQLKLPPIANDSEIGSPMTVAGKEMFVVDLVSDEAMDAGSKTRLLGGILALPGETWFFKMTGPNEVVEPQKEAFRQFLSSIQLSEEGEQRVAQASAPAPMRANSGGSKTDAPLPKEVAMPSAAPLQYKLPPGWEEKPLSTMRLASFKTTGPEGKETDISVVSLPGEAGGDLANVNRWRGQLSLNPIDEETLGKTAEHLKANGHDYLLVDLESDGPANGQPDKQRILAAITRDSDHCWFVKMTGAAAAVDLQKVAFRNFLEGLKLP
jgi:hypothetical protein